MAAIPQAQNCTVFSAKQLAQLEVLEVRPQHFQNMPNAMRQSAPRPQALNTIRATATTNTQVPRMMASQRMRKYFIFDLTGIRCI